MPRILLGLDLGGSAIKAGIVDVDAGRLLSEFISVPTPQPSTPAAVVNALAALAGEIQVDGPIGFGAPTVVKQDRACTAANIDSEWIGAAGGELLARATGRPVAFLNDADAAGLAEMRFGAGRDLQGSVMVLTLGTGIGSAPFIDGRLLPNTELGHLEIHGQDAETWASARVRREESLDWPAWATRVNEYLAHVHALFWPDAFILGGAVSEHFAEFAPHLQSRAVIRPATLGARAGVIGAALAAATLYS